MALSLTPGKALIFRITHRDNVPWILDNGMHAPNGAGVDPSFRNIGNVDLIDKRSRRVVEVPPGGTLSDYVPFYFTPHSIMLLNIMTGYNVKKVPGEDIVILRFITSARVRSGHSVRVYGSTCLPTNGEVFYGSDFSSVRLTGRYYKAAISSLIQTIQGKRTGIKPRL
jgi:hypothetical protein